MDPQLMCAGDHATTGGFRALPSRRVTASTQRFVAVDDRIGPKSSGASQESGHYIDVTTENHRTHTPVPNAVFAELQKRSFRSG